MHSLPGPQLTPGSSETVELSEPQGGVSLLARKRQPFFIEINMLHCK